MEAQDEDLMAKIYIQRRCAKADMVVAYHLGGRLGVDCGRLAQSEFGILRLTRLSEHRQKNGLLVALQPGAHHMLDREREP